jgi:hypothetical protein
MPFAVAKKQVETKIVMAGVIKEMENAVDVLKEFPIRKADTRASCAIIIHCHTANLKPIEKYSLDYSMAVLGDRDYFFVLPVSLQEDYYVENFKKATIVRFPDEFFKSRETYSQLYLGDMLYNHFASTHEFLLILQTDAIVLRDELDYWCSQPWDYLGSPWPKVMKNRPGGILVECLLDRDCFSGRDKQR